ncbi:hypothetical protein SAMN05444161_7000 [Rhizobiales bacterium GAS191]|nr:hypothetical protein SAMN05444161_7000 [Rhizobiales bacterium GAS191]
MVELLDSTLEASIVELLDSMLEASVVELSDFRAAFVHASADSTVAFIPDILQVYSKANGGADGVMA